MKIKLLTAFTLIATLSIASFLSCRKINELSARPAQVKLVKEKFFDEHRGDDPVEKTLVEFLQRKNDSFHFVEKTVNQIGYPRWDKAFKKTNQALTKGSNSGNSPNSFSTYLIPFVRDSQNHVNALMIMKIAMSDTSISYLCDWQYNDTKKTKMPPEHLALLMMKMDNQVFSHQLFEITDTSLFIKNSYAAKYIRLNDTMPPTKLGRDIEMTIELCYTALRPTHEGQVVGVSAGAEFQHYEEYTDCVTIGTYSFSSGSEEIGDPAGGAGADSGSGGDYTPPNPPPPCGGPTNVSRSGVAHKDEPCSSNAGEPGWTPSTPPTRTPPDTLTAIRVYDAFYQGCSVFVAPNGVAITMPVGSQIKYYDNYDLSLFPNGVIYGFITPDGVEYAAAITAEYASGALANSAATFKGFYKVSGDTLTKTIYPSSLFQKAQLDGNRKTKAVRVSKFKEEDGSCTFVRELVEYSPHLDVPKEVQASKVDFGIEISNKVEAVPSEKTKNVSCGSRKINTRYTIQDFINYEASSLIDFLKTKIQSSIKIFIADPISDKTTHSITKAGTTVIQEANQTTQTQQYDNAGFSEDIAIKAYLENGRWEYDIKFNPSVIDPANVHPKARQYLNNALTEFKRQLSEEVQSLQEPGKRSNHELYEVANAEKFYKAGMGLFESLATFSDIAKTLIRDAKMPEYIWNQGRLSSGTDAAIALKYAKSPIKMPTVVSGPFDQLADEATGFYQLFKTGIEAFRKPGATFNGIYNSIKSLDKEKIKQLLSSASGLDNYNAGGDRAVYQGGRHAVQAAMIFFSGVKALGQGAQVVKEAGAEVTKLQKFLGVNPQAADVLKNAAENKKSIKNIGDEKLLTENIVNGEKKYIAIEKKADNTTVFEAKNADFVDENGNMLSEAAIQKALEEGAKDVDLPLNANNSYKRGQTGEWNKELNKHPLVPYKEYDVDGMKYYADEAGFLTKVEIPNLQKSTPPWDRNQYQQTLKCKSIKNGILDGADPDQGGHLIASRFGGPGEQINLVPMKKSLNQAGGDWSNMESAWANKIQNGINITDVKIGIQYGANGRPTKFEISWYENGVQNFATHQN